MFVSWLNWTKRVVARCLAETDVRTLVAPQVRATPFTKDRPMHSPVDRTPLFILTAARVASGV